MPPLWITFSSGVPTASNFATTNGLGSGLIINTSTSTAYYLAAGDVPTALAGGGGGSGTVTSVSASGGTTGLTFSGSPITGSGTLTLSGVLIVANGGTGTNTLTGYVKGNGTAALTAVSSIPVADISGLGSLATQSGTFSGTSSGTNTGDQTITLTGDVTGSGTGSFAATLATVNANVGSFGSGSLVPVLTVDAKGRITAVSTAAVSGALPALQTTEVNISANPRRSGHFTISGSGMTVGKPVSIEQAVGPYTSKGTRADEAEMDRILCSASVTAANLITVYWSSQYKVRGNFKFNYFIGA